MRPETCELPKTLETSELDNIDHLAASQLQNTVIIANLAGMMSTTIGSLIESCDNQYVRLDQIITKQWLKDLMRLYRTLYSSESATNKKSFFLT